MTDTLYRWVKATDALPPAGSEVKMKWDDGDKEWFGDPITELRDVRKQYYHKLLWQQPFTVPVDVEQAAEKQWKSVDKDGYPEYNIGLLVCIPGEDYHITSGMWDVSNKWVLLDDYREPEERVTHYMLLPKAPKEFEKEIGENDFVMEHLAKLLKMGKIKKPDIELDDMGNDPL